MKRRDFIKTSVGAGFAVTALPRNLTRLGPQQVMRGNMQVWCVVQEALRPECAALDLVLGLVLGLGMDQELGQLVPLLRE